MTVTLTLGGFVFRQEFETPDRIAAGGGEQTINTHQLVGGARVFDAMGPVDAPVEWIGRFRGPDAVSRVQAVDAMRKAGKPVSLTYGDFAYTVLIERFRPEMEKPWEIPYAISCLVVSSTAATAAASPGVHAMITGDNAQAQSLGAGFGDTTMDGLLASLDQAVAGVPNFALADRTALQGVLLPLLDVQLRAGALIMAQETVLEAVDGLGGVAAGGRASDMANALLGQVSAMTQVADLYALHNLTGRMATNLAAVGSGGAVVVVTGANLFEIAAAAYGDASEWATIAKANGVTEPMLDGARSLLVPPTSGQTGGVLKEVAGDAADTLAEVIVLPGVDGELDFSNPDNSIFLTV